MKKLPIPKLIMNYLRKQRYTYFYIRNDGDYTFFIQLDDEYDRTLVFKTNWQSSYSFVESDYRDYTVILSYYTGRVFTKESPREIHIVNGARVVRNPNAVIDNIRELVKKSFKDVKE